MYISVPEGKKLGKGGGGGGGGGVVGGARGRMKFARLCCIFPAKVLKLLVGGGGGKNFQRAYNNDKMSGHIAISCIDYYLSIFCCLIYFPHPLA